ncbi:hypothetical protein M0R19_08195 [Candidatus Pacearchaeota archaeon]|jgi:hypothetical protein|nr:hypothetical protein [bacterium]MCK9597138.1 hypothetical protein [Candidatus Pacearchaeota archaeon]
MDKLSKNYLDYDLKKHLEDQGHSACRTCGEKKVYKIINGEYIGPNKYDMNSDKFHFTAVYVCGHSQQWYTSIHSLENYYITRFTIKIIKK